MMRKEVEEVVEGVEEVVEEVEEVVEVVEEVVEEEEEVIEIPNLQSRSIQQILDSSSGVENITHHEGSGHTYMANKILKLQNMYNPNSSDSGHIVKSDIFKGCYLFVNGDTTPSRYEIQRLV